MVKGKLYRKIIYLGSITMAYRENEKSVWWWSNATLVHYKHEKCDKLFSIFLFHSHNSIFPLEGNFHNDTRSLRMRRTKSMLEIIMWEKGRKKTKMNWWTCWFLHFVLKFDVINSGKCQLVILRDDIKSNVTHYNSLKKFNQISSEICPLNGIVPAWYGLMCPGVVGGAICDYVIIIPGLGIHTRTTGRKILEDCAPGSQH